MSDNINFKGAFLVHKPTKILQQGIMSRTGKHRQIFHDFAQKGDMLLITRKGRDSEIAEFITQHRANFKVYPKLSTKSGFDDQKPLEAMEILKNTNTPVLTKKTELIDWYKLYDVFVRKAENKQKKLNDNIFKALGFNKKEEIIKNKNGYSIITDTNGKLLAKVSAPGRYGISFAYIEPKTTDDSPLRYAIKEGKVIFEYTSENGRLQFIKNYNKAVNDAKNA